MSNVRDQIAQLSLLPETEERIEDYYEFQWRMNSGMDREKFLLSLSPCLRNEILLSVYADIVSNVSFFKGIQDAPDFICLIVERLSTAFYLPSDVIVHQGELTSSLSYIYFITIGQCAVYHPENPEKIIHQMESGSFFGEMGYLDVGGRRSSSVCALTNCDIALLQFKDIDALVETFPAFRDHMEVEMRKHVRKYREGSKLVRRLDKKASARAGSLINIFESDGTTNASTRLQKLVDARKKEAMLDEEEDSGELGSVVNGDPMDRTRSPSPVKRN